MCKKKTRLAVRPNIEELQTSHIEVPLTLLQDEQTEFVLQGMTETMLALSFTPKYWRTAVIKRCDQPYQTWLTSQVVTAERMSNSFFNGINQVRIDSKDCCFSQITFPVCEVQKKNRKQIIALKISSQMMEDNVVHNFQ